MESNKHWTSRIKFLAGKGLAELEREVNNFCIGKFVVGIQYPELFQDEELTAVISYKVKE